MAADFSRRIIDEIFNRVDEGGGGMATLSGRWGTCTVDLGGGLEHNTVRLANSPVSAFPSITIMSALAGPTDPRLKQLVSCESKEIGHAIEIFVGELSAWLLEDFTDPALGSVTPSCQVFVVVVSVPEEGNDVVLEELIRAHGR